ncbi:MAG TPA: OmpA family protein [Thermoanaerobaculia bacterium]|jgi:outer membrane protein OmpA-like peptidoglycan-associated protein|nr:OmpA family protein [Thermoanaerobaculia bacterium]
MRLNNVILALLALAAGAAQPAKTAPPPENLAGLASGAVVVIRPTAGDANGEAWFLLDEDLRTGWTSLDGKHLEPTVIELPDRSVIRTVQFDTGLVEFDGRLPKRVLVEMSDTSATAGFKPIADVTLSPAMKDGQVFKTTAEVPGRWIRLAVKSMQAPDHTIAQLMEFRAFGERLTHNAAPSVAGTYVVEGGPLMHLREEGGRVTGCFEGDGGGPIEGGLEGRALRFNWKLGTDEGPAIGVFGSAATFFGFWKTNGAEPNAVLTVVDVKKKSAAPGDCPNWHAADPLAAELEKSGRVRLYGINFDSDSDVLRPESKGTLDQIVATLKKDAALKITIEGHTDSTSTPQHNQQLSEKRAVAVKAYLVAGGIDAGRLATAGFGSSRPVATNESAIGRAENRRVEIVRR